MTTLELSLSDDIMEHLQREAERRNVSLDSVINAALEFYFNEPTDEEILENLRESMEDALAGRVRPVDEVLAELKQEFDFHGNES